MECFFHSHLSRKQQHLPVSQITSSFEVLDNTRLCLSRQLSAAALTSPISSTNPSHLPQNEPPQHIKYHHHHHYHHRITTMGAFPSHSAPSGYSQEISLKKKSLALLQSSRSPNTATQPTSPQPQPYPETYTISSSSSSPPTRNQPAPNFADSHTMSDSQCTTSTSTSSLRTSDPGSTPGASPSSSFPESDGETRISPASGPSSTSNSSSSSSDPSPPAQSSQVSNEPLPSHRSPVKTGTKRAAPSP